MPNKPPKQTRAIRYIFDVETRPAHGEWSHYGAKEAEAGTLFGAQQQIEHELRDNGMRDDVRFRLIAAIVV